MTKLRGALSTGVVVACLLGASRVLALEEKQITEVWPLDQRQQYLYYFGDKKGGESWVEITPVPRTRDRFLMTNTIEVDGVPYGARMKLDGKSVAELDAFGRPVSYELELHRSSGTTTMSVVMNYPHAEMHIAEGDSTREESPRYHEDSRLLDFVFIGPWDLAFRLDPMHPASSKARRNYFVPQLEVNVMTDFIVQYEETLTLLDGTEMATVRVDVPSLLTNVWLDPKGRVVKAEVPSEKLTIHIGETRKLEPTTSR